VILCASRSPNRRVFRRSQILALGTAYLLIYRLGSSVRRSVAFALKNSAAFTSTWYSTVVLHYPCSGPVRPRARQFCASSVPAPLSNPSIFQRYPCSHCGRLGVVQPFRDFALQRLMRSAPGTASSISRKQLLCKLFLFCNLACQFTLECRISTRKPLGHLPSPEDGPRTPTGQSLASEMLRSELSCGPCLTIEVSNHRRTFAHPAPRCGTRLRTSWIEQSAYQTSFPANPYKFVVSQLSSTQNRRNHRLPLRFSEGRNP
jgi:hypothetical protein